MFNIVTTISNDKTYISRNTKIHPLTFIHVESRYQLHPTTIHAPSSLVLVLLNVSADFPVEHIVQRRPETISRESIIHANNIGGMSWTNCLSLLTRIGIAYHVHQVGPPLTQPHQHQPLTPR